jgi:PAS domain S-box-containing protein
MVQDITILGEGTLPVPFSVSVGNISRGQHLGQLVRVTGRIDSPKQFQEYPPRIHLSDSSDTIFMYVSNRLLRDPEFAARLSAGGNAEIVGIVENSEGLPPYDSTYQIRPRGVGDVHFRPAPPIREVALVVVICLGLFSVFHLWRRRSEAEKAVKELTALGENLRRSEEALRDSNQRLEAVLHSSPLAIVTQDLDGTVQTWNPAAEQLFQWRSEEVIGVRLPVVPEDEQEIYQENKRRLSRGEVLHLEEVRPQRKDGSRFDASLAIAPLYDQNRRMKGVMAIIQDVTEKKQWNARLLEMQKMEAVGQLAGGIAHDFNNSLGAILGWAEFALEGVEDESRFRKPLDYISQQARRSADLTRELVAFSRRQALEKQNVELNSVVEQTLSLMSRMLPADVAVEKALASDLPPVLADPTQVERILMNLCLNARDAMPAGGTLRLATEQAQINEDDCRRFTDARPGNYAVLSISDTGQGMDQHTLSRIFEPFFTTKRDGKGTGLGLAVVYGIVKQHGGFIHVYSELGHGTTFRVYFPAGNHGAKKSAQSAVQTAGGNHELILLAEDHAGYREIAQQTLEDLGYRVLAAADGKEALQIFHDHRDEIAVAILDVVMPGIRGPELYKQMLVERPQLPVIFASGYSLESDSLIAVRSRNVLFLQKPYSQKTLGQKVREILDQNPPKNAQTLQLETAVPDQSGGQEIFPPTE